MYVPSVLILMFEWFLLPRFSVGQFSLTGPNHPNEDRAIFSPKAFTDDKGVEVRVYGTIDGHGGSFIADYVTTHLLEKILRKDKFIDVFSIPI